jgi:hypothetical protein
MQSTKKVTIAVTYIRTNKNRLRHYESFVNEHAKGLGAQVAKQFSDTNEIADPSKRPVLQALLEYIAANAADYVILPHLHMISRQTRELIELADEIEKAGARLITPVGEEVMLPTYRLASKAAAANEENTSSGICPICNEHKLAGSGCTVNTISCNERFYDRIKAGDESDIESGLNKAGICAGCGVKRGQCHHWNCEYEECPFCREHLANCDCEVSVLMDRECIQTLCG